MPTMVYLNRFRHTVLAWSSDFFLNPDLARGAGTMRKLESWAIARSDLKASDSGLGIYDRLRKKSLYPGVDLPRGASRPVEGTPKIDSRLFMKRTAVPRRFALSLCRSSGPLF